MLGVLVDLRRDNMKHAMKMKMESGGSVPWDVWGETSHWGEADEWECGRACVEVAKTIKNAIGNRMGGWKGAKEGDGGKWTSGKMKKAF